MKQSNALAYLRQLCCSGLGKGIVIPEFLRAVQSVIPSGNNTFSGCDEYLTPAYHMIGFDIADIDEQTPIVISSYVTPERRSRSLEMFRYHQVITDVTLWDESFYKSDLYNLVNRRYDQHHVLWALTRQHDKPTGILSLYRPRQQKPFNSREQALLIHMLPYVAHALLVSDDYDIRYGEKGSSGMMIMDTQGTLIYLSHEAKMLLALACQPSLTMDARRHEYEIMSSLAQLCLNLEAVFRGQQAAPPSWCYTGPNGRFLFRAYWLNQQNNEPGGLVGMTIEHQEPLVLEILRALRKLSLSPSQKEVALLLALDMPSEKIGERLHIKPTTVKDHIRKIFIKVDIHHRGELLPKLLASDSSKIS